MDYDTQLINLALDAGEIMLASGAETFRVQDTMQRILSVSGKEKIEALAMCTLLMVTLPREEKGPLSMARAVKNRDLNFEKICAVNDMSRAFVSGKISVTEALDHCQEIHHAPNFKFRTRVLGYAISGAGASFGTVAGNIIDELTVENFVDFATTHVGGFNSVTSSLMVLFCIILMAYAVIKVFFANLKRGGILLIQIAVGSLYMFSVPRGYLDGFYQWCKQVVGLCLTAFLQATILIAGLSLFNEHALLGLGLMLSAGEIPRIAGAFGLDTSTRANLSSAVYTAQTAINITKTVAKAAAA